jgi:fumarate hydratase class II
MTPQTALAEGKTLREVAVDKLKLVTPEAFDEIIVPANMIHPTKRKEARHDGVEL